MVRPWGCRLLRGSLRRRRYWVLRSWFMLRFCLPSLLEIAEELLDRRLGHRGRRHRYSWSGVETAKEGQRAGFVGMTALSIHEVWYSL